MMNPIEKNNSSVDPSFKEIKERVEWLGKTIKSLDVVKHGLKVGFWDHAFQTFVSWGVMESLWMGFQGENATTELVHLENAKREIKEDLRALDAYINGDNCHDLGCAEKLLDEQPGIEKLLNTFNSNSRQYRKITSKKHPLQNLKQRLEGEIKPGKYVSALDIFMFQSAIVNGEINKDEIVIESGDTDADRERKRLIAKLLMVGIEGNTEQETHFAKKGLIDELQDTMDAIEKLAKASEVRLKQFNLIKMRREMEKANNDLSQSLKFVAQSVDEAGQVAISVEPPVPKKDEGLGKDKGKEKAEPLPQEPAPDSIQENEPISEASIPVEPKALEKLTPELYTMPPIGELKGVLGQDPTRQLLNKLRVRGEQIEELEKAMNDFKKIEDVYNGYQSQIDRLREEMAPVGEESKQEEGASGPPVPPPPPGAPPPPPAPAAPPPPPARGASAAKSKPVEVKQSVKLSVQLDLPEIKEHEETKTGKAQLLAKYKEAEQQYKRVKQNIIDTVLSHISEKFAIDELQSYKDFEPFINKFLEEGQKEIELWKRESETKKSAPRNVAKSGEESSDHLSLANKAEIISLQSHLTRIAQYETEHQKLKKQFDTANKVYKRSIRDVEAAEEAYADEVVKDGPDVEQLSHSLKEKEEYRNQKLGDCKQKREAIIKLRDDRNRSAEVLKGKFPDLFSGELIDLKELTEKVHERIEYLRRENPKAKKPESSKDSETAQGFQLPKLRETRPGNRYKGKGPAEGVDFRSRLKKVGDGNSDLRRKIGRERDEIRNRFSQAWDLRRNKPGDAGWNETIQRLEKSPSSRALFSLKIYEWVDRIFSAEEVPTAALPKLGEVYLGDKGFTDRKLIEKYADSVAQMVGVSADQVKEHFNN